MINTNIALNTELVDASAQAEQLHSMLTYYVEQFYESDTNESALFEVRNRYQLICSYTHAISAAVERLTDQINKCLEISERDPIDGSAKNQLVIVANDAKRK